MEIRNNPSTSVAVGAWLGQIPPVFFIAVYLLLVPCFAYVYTILPESFYAADIKFEPYFGKDKDVIRSLLNGSIRRNIGAQKLPDSIRTEIYKMDIEDDGSFVLHISISFFSDYYTQDYYASFDCIVKAQIRFYQGLMTHHLLELASPYFESKSGNADKLYNQVFKPSGFDDMPPDRRGIPLDDDGYDQITQLLNGGRGDALLISGSYLRMLYFSSTVITTTGFGDIVPVTTASRTIVSIEELLGVTILGLFLNSLATKISTSTGPVREDRVDTSSKES